MRRNLLPFLVLFSALFIFASCLKSNEDTTDYPDDAAITSFKLGTLNQKVTTVSSDQTTTTTTTTLDCSGYAFYIDQATREIYNPDSLPYGVDASKVICTISSKNSGTVTIKSLTNDSLRYYTSTDSIDFSQPRQLVVYSYSANYTRSYTVRVNVHKQKSGEFAWVGYQADPALAALEAMKGVTTADHIFIFGKKNGQALLYGRSTTTNGNFALISPNISLTVDAYKNVTSMGGVLYLFNQGQIYRSTDGATWTAIGGASLRQLIGATNARLYAYDSTGALVSSADGLSWRIDPLSSDISKLPTTNLNLCYKPLITNVNTNNVVLIGNRDVLTDSTAMVWGKVEEDVQGAQNQPWGYFTIAGDNKYPIPNLSNLQVIDYNGTMIALGGAGQGANKTKAFDKLYQSQDGGITWQMDSTYVLPTSFSSSETSFTMTVDKQQFVWIICGGSGQIWRARLTDLGWPKEQTVFTK